jgi:5'-nucleotidase
LYGDTQYLDPIQTANKTAAHLKDELKCDLVICLSHLGYKYDDKKVSDVVLANISNDIDLILGGHTHTFMKQPDEIVNEKGHKVLVNQVGWAGIQLGRIDFYFEPKKKIVSSAHLPLLVKTS